MATQDETTTTAAPASDGQRFDAPASDGQKFDARAEGATSDTEAAPAVRKRATRKRASAAKTTDTATDADTGAAETGSAEDQATASPRTRARKATSKKAKTAAEAQTSDTATDAVAASGEVAGEDAPRARAPRTRANKKASAKAVAPAVDQPAADADTDADDEAETDDDAETDEDATGETAPSAGAGFGVLFQAPDLAAAPSRRRATRPASPPVAKAADEDEVTDAAGAVNATQEPETDSSADSDDQAGRRRRRRGGKGRRGRGSDTDTATEAAPEEAPTASGADPEEQGEQTEHDPEGDPEGAGSRRRRRRRRAGTGGGESDDPPGTVTRVREPRARDQVAGVKGSTRLEAKKQRRREGREAGRRRTIITEAEFLARRESVDRVMVVREKDARTQIAVLEDGVLVEHYVSRETNASMAGNIYLGRVQNVLPSMEAAFVDIGKGRNAVLYAGEVNWDAAGLEGNAPKRIENALKSGDSVLVQVTKDPIGHKGARLTSQISLPGRYLVYVPEGSMTGISRKLPDTERSRLKAILKEVIPNSAGVIVRTAAEGASEEELRADVERLTQAWDKITAKAGPGTGKKGSGGGAPMLVHGEPDLTVRVIRDIFNEDFASVVVAGDQAWGEVRGYVQDVAPDLADRVTKWTSEDDVFTAHRVHEQLAKAMDRKVWLPSGGSLVIDRTEAMTVVDVNTGKFVGSGGNLEETVTKNNIEAAEEIVRQLRLRDIGGIIVIDFIDMVLESNRDLVVRRLLECLGRDRTKHQVAEVTSLGLVQMTRKRVGSGLIEVFSEPCEHCNGRGLIVHSEPVDKGADNSHNHGPDHGNGNGNGQTAQGGRANQSQRRGRGGEQSRPADLLQPPAHHGPTAAQIAAAAHAAAMKVALVAPADLGAAKDGPFEVVVEPAGKAPVEAGQATEQPLDAPVSELLGMDLPRPVVAPETTAYEPPPASVIPTPRRKRGRVVAPAGPPRHPASGATPLGDAG